MKKCACGCGISIPKINKKGKFAKFVHGHNNRNIKWPLEIREKVSKSLREWYKDADKDTLKNRYHKISISNQGKKPSEGSFIKGHSTWNKGKVGYLAGKTNPNWKGGRAFMNGYWFIRVATGKYKKKARIVMGEYLKKDL